MGYRVRRDISGITHPSSDSPFGEVAGQFKAKDTVTDVCFSTRGPCNFSQFAFYGSGIFFRGFRNNLDPVSGTYLIDYPPGAPADACDSCRVFVDPANLGGFTSRYAVTSIDTVRITNSDFTESAIDSNEIVTVVPSSPPADNLEKAAVVPNPFKGSAEWDPAVGENRVHFIHLMSGSTVRVFTTNGDLVRELVHDPSANPGGATGDLEWDLRNGYGNPIVSGIYIYQVQSPQGHTTRGHFVVIR